MKIISWNVNGIRAVLNKGFKKFVEDYKPDILCLQEIKAHPDQVDKIMNDYEHFWNSAKRKGYAGTAIFSKDKPLGVNYGIGIEEHDNEGRIITLEFSKFYLVNVYVPNSQVELRRLSYRERWDKEFLKYLKILNNKKPVIITGDFNVAHTEIDLANPKSNYNQTAGYTQIEIDGFSNYIKNGFADSFREFNKESKHYTYWSYRFNARKKDIGWRIDYFLVSKVFMKNVRNCTILKNVLGSDHCPIVLDIKNF